MRVIVVDDESDILEDIKDTILEHERFEVVGTYTNPLAALDDISRTEPECAFLDIEMPGMGGIDLAEKLLTLNPEMEIVFITAFNHYATQAFEVEAMDYVLKPVHPQRFAKTMERLIKNQDLPTSSVSTEVIIRSLGGFEVLLDGKPVKWNRSKARELLAYLLHHRGHKKSKYRICEDLWPDYEPKKALVNLQTAMCSLRKSLGAVGRDNIRIVFSDESYVLSPGRVRWDVDEFMTLSDRAKSTQDISCAEEAVALYHGEYMGNEDWQWAQLTLECLARKYEDLLQIIAEYSFRQEDFDEAVAAIMKLAQSQAVDEKMQLMLAKAAYACHGISGLSRQVNNLRNLYQKEYDMELSAEVIQYCLQEGVKI